ncbi:MAG TPA: CxxxxCH/CxxCH domain-containing protein [Kofleriaceae bacterium]|nr:CxxxxCH/CxxCH domain-containing protein [Kofleriaceae bacterium]
MDGFVRWLGVCALVLAAACNLGNHAVPDGGTNTNLGPSTGCSGVCHGAGDSIAPPRDTGGRSNTSAIGVGAHQQHLKASTWHQTFDCVTCHKVPVNVGDPGHIFNYAADGTPIRITGPAALIFSGLGVGASWDHDSATCTSSYCHGDTLHQTDPSTNQVIPGAGGTITQPVWTTVDGTQSKCGACHGLPPPAPHPQNQDCGLCHQSMNPGDFAAGKISYPALHIDGKVEVASTQPCDSCHGGGGIYSPPKDAHGNTATTAPGVGAHAQHMTTTSAWHASINCNECHLVPGSTTDETHLDGIDEVYMDPTIQVPGSPTGTGGHLQIPGAVWNSTAFTCTNTYCHGGGASPLTGGGTQTPLWTKVDGTQSQCTSCHGMPPPAPHPVDSDCGKCHPTMTAGNNTTITYPAKHIDGNVDVIDDQPCNTCHGDATATPVAGDNLVNAPPVDTTGGMSTSLRGVGAHQAHMGPSTWRAPISCGECHTVPTSLLSIGHVDHPLPAYVKFGNLAGTASSWNGSTCSGVYCHGATLSDGGVAAGGSATKPVWTTVDGSQSQCGSCHGLPPPTPAHASVTAGDLDCGKCHDQTMTAGQPGVITNPALHIDGAVEVNTDQPCNQCHGSAGTPTSNGAAINAPPKDTLGNTATNTRGVGAHQSHLTPSSLFFKQVLCQDCHTVPAAVNSVGHIDHPLPAYVIFSTRAGSSPTWNGATCANVYCHGATLSDGSAGAGGAATSPIWAKVDGSQAQCTSCHGNPPPAPHPQQSDCGTCHNDVTPGAPTTFSDPTRHIDGNLDVTSTQACNSCHGNHTSTPTSNSDPVNAPPFDSTGTGSSTTLRGVGAHQSHLQTSAWRAAITCGECHTVPATVESVGHIDHPLPATMTFTGTAALAPGTTWDGANCTSYCHGASLTGAGGTATSPQWTLVDGSQSQCGSCHGNPPPTSQGHPANATDCGSCHMDVMPGAPTTFTNPAQHIDGTVQVNSQHPAGYQMMQMHGYDFDQNGPSTCATASCHGTALTGGSTGGPSCTTVTGCHDQVGSGYTWQTQCTFCHGDITNPAGNGAPPQGVEGATTATDPTVGAHQIHLGATATHAAWDCTMCHTKPTTALTPGHISGNGTVQATMVFSSLNPASTYSVTAYTCANNYCHGTGSANGTSPAWTSTTALTCTSCHGDPPNTGEHGEDDHKKAGCKACHYTTTTTSTTITNVALHLNGVKDVSFQNGGTFTPNGTKGTCSGTASGCHGTKTETW